MARLFFNFKLHSDIFWPVRLSYRSIVSTSAPDPSLASKAYQAISSPFRLLYSIIPRVSYEITLATRSGSRLLYLRTELGSPISQETDHSTSPVVVEAPKTFPQFKKLPPELRSKIWECALSEPRIFWPGENRASWETMNFVHKPPAARQTCHEARQVSQKLGVVAFGQNGTIKKGLWFNLLSDILYLDRRCFLTNDELLPTVREEVRNVALDWDECCYFDDYAGLLRDILGAFPRCRRVIFVERTDELLLGGIAFFAIQDEEECTWFDEDWKWGAVKEDMRQDWCSEDLLEELDITEDQLPSIEAVEAAPVRQKKSICRCREEDVEF
ncbi:hypothetical protein NM208_g10831 [Fusarium decemcellulare]|uniref:Uncharacterized protein n=1 Tax=Fusarium decemcellulare TaxID=57161 RepID=A0ACC1RWJ5_9HYPO|nr:hypothetical protein NM208_g10831 [Fusarium decemcellulare]